MSEPAQTLEQLQAAGWHPVDPNAPPPQPSVGPRGSERMRPDAASIIGVDHEKLRQAITDWAVTSPHVPDALRVAAARGGTYFGDVLASLAELFSAPESVAGAVAPKAVPALDAVGEAHAALQRPADVAIDALMKRSGIDPDAINLQATRMRLQAARSRTRQARMAADQPSAAAAPTPTPAAAPAATPPAAAASPMPAPTVPTPPPTAAPARAGWANALNVLMKEGGLSAAEAAQALKWADQGVPLETIQERILTSRSLTQSLKTPTPDKAATEVARMAAEAAKRRK